MDQKIKDRIQGRINVAANCVYLAYQDTERAITQLEENRRHCRESLKLLNEAHSSLVGFETMFQIPEQE